MTEETPRLWTRAIADILVDAINKDAKMMKYAARMSETIELRCLDTPEGTDVAARYEFRGGKAGLVSWDEQPSPASFRSDSFNKKELLARTCAPFSIWVKLDKGEMGVIDAILSPHYKFEGAKLRVIKNLRVFQRVSEISSSIPKRYA